jgi:Down syndrome cell adhesion molecule
VLHVLVPFVPGLIFHRTFATSDRNSDALQYPTFITEPSSRLTFSNDTGSKVSCAAHGNPTPLVTWLFKDGSTVNSVPGLR